MPDLILQALPKEAKAVADSTAVMKESFEHKIEALAEMPTDKLLETLTHWGISVSEKLLLALAVYFVGRWLIRYILKIQKRIMDRKETDPSLRVFLNNLTQISLTIILISFIIGVLGINTTSFVAIFASAGLAVGMALSGTLQNFAGGVMILLIKPFRVGHYVEMQGQAGTVKEIRLFHTVLNTSDNKTIMMPNGAISNGIINNYTREDYRRAEWTFGLAYGEDYDKAKNVIRKLLDADPRAQKTPEPAIVMSGMDQNSVKVLVTAWAHTNDFWSLYYSINEQVYKTFGGMGINMASPHMEIRLKDDRPHDDNNA